MIYRSTNADGRQTVFPEKQLSAPELRRERSQAPPVMNLWRLRLIFEMMIQSFFVVLSQLLLISTIPPSPEAVTILRRLFHGHRRCGEARREDSGISHRSWKQRRLLKQSNSRRSYGDSRGVTVMLRELFHLHPLEPELVPPPAVVLKRRWRQELWESNARSLIGLEPVLIKHSVVWNSSAVNPTALMLGTKCRRILIGLRKTVSSIVWISVNA